MQKLGVARRQAVVHVRVPMAGRDPSADHRAATPLELLFDLAFVIAFSVAGEQFAHALAAAHVGWGLAAFVVAVFAIVLAWVNHTWFASAFDTDDWLYRLATMVQMSGVVVLALGLPPMFETFRAGHAVDNRVMVLGYLIMRVAMVSQWLRVARESPGTRRAALVFAGSVAAAQVGWVLLAVWLPRPPGFVTGAALLAVVELVGPAVAFRMGSGLPWHPHHVAERYGLLTIITLGEVLLGTTAAVGAVVGSRGWSLAAALVLGAGVVMTFGLWWLYFFVPFGDLLAAHRNRAVAWGYGHVVIFGAIAAVGSGLHVAAYSIEGHVEISEVGVLATTAVPMLAFFIGLAVLTTGLAGTEVRILRLTTVEVAAVAVAGALAAAGVGLPICLAVLALAPAVTVLDVELFGLGLPDRTRDGAPSD
ncbi:MAG: low temperature requirement protein A [Acidimicrobiales bacterium]